MTLQEDNVGRILTLGFEEVKPTTKYRCFAYPNQAESMRVFLGRRGAVRWGRTVVGSTPVYDWSSLKYYVSGLEVKK